MRRPEESAQDTARWEWIYRELLRIEQHRTDELQNQQDRIRSVLTVNGFLLGFLAATGVLGPGASSLPRPILVIYVISLIVLSAGLTLGIVSLLPRIAIRGRSHAHGAHSEPQFRGLFLDAEYYIAEAPGLQAVTLYRALAEDLARDLEATNHVGTLRRRRTLINWQLLCIGISVLLLAVVLLGIAIR